MVPSQCVDHTSLFTATTRKRENKRETAKKRTYVSVLSHSCYEYIHVPPQRVIEMCEAVTCVSPAREETLLGDAHRRFQRSSRFAASNKTRARRPMSEGSPLWRPQTASVGAGTASGQPRTPPSPG